MDNQTNIKNFIKKSYGEIAKTSGQCGCGSCGCNSGKMDYSADEMNQVPAGANLGLGCGNPVAIASLKKGEVVLD